MIARIELTSLRIVPPPGCVKTMFVRQVTARVNNDAPVQP